MDYITKCIIGSVIIVAVALIGYFYTPKTRSAFGYKSPRSLKNDVTWNYANTLAKRLFVLVAIIFIISEVVLFLFFENHYSAYKYSFSILTITSTLIIPIVEISLRLKFDKNGKTKN